MLPKTKIRCWRAGLLATAIVLPASTILYIQQNTDLLLGSFIFAVCGWLCGLILLPGIVLTACVAATVTLTGNTSVAVTVISHQFTVVMPVLNWIFYFGVFLLIFRRRERVSAGSV
jgi:hypothetical protein